MPMTLSRRRVLSAIGLAGAGALAAPRVRAAEAQLETTTVRLAKNPVICFAPLYVCEDLLRMEGFTDIRYVDTKPASTTLSQDLAEGKCDFASNVTATNILFVDSGLPITLVAGIHAGCYELFASAGAGIRNIRDLKGKRVGTIVATDLLEMMAAFVGLDPKKDLTIINDPEAKPLDQFIQGKLDAYMALPPEPQLLHARGFGEVIVRTATDRPWSQYFCCTLAAWRDFVARNPVATKRVIRAMLKAADLCASEPERAARRLVDGGFVDNYEYALQTLNDNPYAHWRDYDAEDTVRFYALRLREVGAIKKLPQRIIADGTDFRFFDELKRELKA
jgi:NitT/TauT family transport system substrate-binding protein